jgi:urea ABC transporter permease protein UrtC
MRKPLTLRILSSLDKQGWLALGIFLALALVVVPVLHLLARKQPLHVSTYAITLIGKIMCYALVAVAMDLIWGYGGILSLGHGLFFALGGYAFGMYLMRQIGRDGSYGADLPDFMVFLDWKELPWFWVGSDSFGWAAFLVMAVPALVAFVFGYFAFRSRIKGVYFSIITQALTYAAMLLFFRNETGFGGNNGFTDFKRVLGYDVTAPDPAGAVRPHRPRAGIDLAAWLVKSKFGRVLTAIRDAENRVMFIGYNPLWYKHLGRVGRAVRHCRRAVRAAGGHHQPVRDVARQLHRNRHLGGRRRARHADRADHRRLRGQSGQELVHRQLPRILAVLPRPAVHRRHADAAARPGRPVEETDGTTCKRKGAEA